MGVLLMFVAGFAQPANLLTDSNNQFLRHCYLLPDAQYSFEQILTDTTLPFKADSKMTYQQSGVYWVKIPIANPSQYARKYALFSIPFFDNTIYYYDQDAKKWVVNKAGMLTTARTRVYGRADCIIQGGATNTIYLRMDIRRLDKFSGFLNAVFLLRKDDYAQRWEQLNWTICLATVLLVCLFLVYNAIIFYHTCDRAYLYYLLIQLGGIIYSIAAIQGFNYLVPWQGFVHWLSPQGELHHFNLNTFCNRFSTFVIVVGYVQFARHYLQTSAHLPRLDTWVKWITTVWAVFDLVHTLLNWLGKYQDDQIQIMLTNIGIALIMLLILAITFVAQRRGIYAARYFLWANMASLLLILALAVSFIFDNSGQTKLWMPGAALVMQALMFAMALVARLRQTKEQMALKQSEAEQLKTDIAMLEQQHQQLTAEHQQLEAARLQEQNRSEALEDKLAANNRQLAAAALYIVQKNELLGQLKSNIKTLSNKLPHGSKDLRTIESNLQHNQFLDNDWEKFKLHFEQVHPRFFENLKAQYPGLTQNETRLCAYFHMNLGTKEIAGLLNIDPASVRRAKTRLNKKMNGALAGIINGE